MIRAITKPTSIHQLSTKFDIDEPKIKSTIDDLIKSEQVSGKVAKGLFVPASFSRMQIQTVRQYFEENHFIDK